MPGSWAGGGRCSVNGRLARRRLRAGHPFTAVFGYTAVVIGYVYGVLLTLHPLLKRWNYDTRRASDGTTHRVSLEFFGFQVDSWPRWLIPAALGLLLLATASWLLRQALAPHRALLSALLGPDPPSAASGPWRRPAPRPWTTRRRPCAVSNATCTTGRRPGSSASRCISR
ncbi:hypothetical protein O1M63_13330 [Streptomyces mirabilis]|nr:hypothetical protein [Streptomyces mirabilis]